MNIAPLQIVMMLTSGLVGCGMIAIIGGFLHHRRERLLTHAERMKALEMGREFPDDPKVAQMRVLMNRDESKKSGDDSASGRCYSTAFWVAFWGFITMGGVVRADIPVVIPILMALAVAAIGVVSMICGTILAKKEMDEGNALEVAFHKPAYEPDAFDVVGSRG